jgi:hypothetical protein
MSTNAHAKAAAMVGWEATKASASVLAIVGFYVLIIIEIVLVLGLIEALTGLLPGWSALFYGLGAILIGIGLRFIRRMMH